MAGFEDELRLIAFLTVNAAVLAGAWRLAGRTAGERGQRFVDAMLLWYLTQYVSVCLTGLAGVLNVFTMDAVALAIAAAMWFAGETWGRHEPVIEKDATEAADAPTRVDRWLVPLAALFATGVVAAFAVNQSYFPVASTDPLVYHMPTAVHWLQAGSLALYDAWYWMPANTYSPLAGTAFTVWLMAPMGNDVLARAVQAPALALLGATMFALCRSLGVARSIAALLAVAAVVSRPFLSQALLPKDDLFASAFFFAAVAACAPALLRQWAAPWRIGVLIGLLLATKYTVLLTIPVLVLAIDAPWRAGWRPRQWAIALGLIAILAAPWYVRNAVLTGNPLYPVDVTVRGVTLLTGMFTPDRSETLQSIGGVWGMLADTYHSMPPIVLVPLLLLSLAAIVVHAPSILRDPLRRLVLLGPALGLTVFVLKSPHAEVRYMFPLFLLLFAAGAMAIGWLQAQRTTVAVAVAGALALAALATSFRASNAELVVQFTLAGAGLMIVGGAWLAADRRWPRSSLRIGTIVVAGIALFLGMYVYWRAYIQEYRDLTRTTWAELFAETGEAWAFIDEHVPPDATIASANATTVYPLYGFEGRRRVVHAPVRAGVRHLHDLPRLPDRIRADDVIRTMGRVTSENADRDVWLANLRASGAAYLFVSKNEANTDPPELRFAAADAGTFVKLFDNAGAAVYELNWLAQ